MNRSRWLKIGLWVAVAVALYALAAMLLGPPIAERQLRQYLAESAGLEVATDRVRIDPFTLVAEFENLVLSRPGEAPLLATDAVFARFAAASLWRRGLDLSMIELFRPRFSIRVPADALGLARWVAARTTGDRPLRIRQIEILDGKVWLELPGDRRRAVGLEQLFVTGIVLDGAGDKAGRFRLSARHSLGGSLAIAARLGNKPLASSGSWSLELADVGAVARWLETDLERPAGRLSASGEFSVDGDDPALRLAGLSLHGEDLELHDRASNSALRLDDVRLEDAELDLRQRIFTASRIAIDGGALAVGGPPGGGSWSDTLARFTAASWTLRADRAGTRGLELEFGAAGNRWQLRELELDLTGLDSAASTRAEFTAATMLAADAPLRARGWLAPGTPAMEATVALSGLDLGALEFPLSLTPTLQLGSGRATAGATVSYGPDGARAEGRVELSDLALTDRDDRQQVLTAAGVELDGIVIDRTSTRPSVERIRLRDPRLNLVLDARGRLEPGNWFGLEAAPMAVGGIDVAGGELSFADERVAPPLQIRAAGLSGAIEGLDAGPAGSASLQLEGRVNETGTVTLVANWRPGNPRREGVFDLNLNAIDQPILSAYATLFAGRRVESGVLNLGLRYLFRGDRYRGRQHWMFDALRLGDWIGPDAPDLPLDLAVALLEDRTGRIDVTVPAAGRLDRDSALGAALGRSLLDYLAALEADPFQILGTLVGNPDVELGVVAFEPGTAAITAPSAQRLAELSNALEQRPALALRIPSGFAPNADRAALARQQVRLHVALATSAGPPGSGDPGPPAYGDPKVQSVLDEFAGERLAAAERAAIEARFAAGERTAFYRALFEALVAGEQIAEPALRKLARYRAQSISNQLTNLGVAAERLRPGDPVAVAEDGSPQVAVPLRLEVM